MSVMEEENRTVVQMYDTKINEYQEVPLEEQSEYIPDTKKEINQQQTSAMVGLYQIFYQSFICILLVFSIWALNYLNLAKDMRGQIKEEITASIQMSDVKGACDEIIEVINNYKR